uniref:AlNc14C117G6553 protein n=1 Tax=Albugo laibachii Nc14 TaxID=890382 RepID=F0WJ22_9STRA|nr:AlNc14C117G6553 [Albugo laibachii Nc14]CCA21642.1 AlNc14C129G6891 [Albugo laibachii Nc14]|eukprot:CCA21642.1 AlNc14C129G6891 [Albugo laibachii Nc14]
MYRRLKPYVHRYLAVNDCIAVIKIKDFRSIQATFINVYASHSGRPQAEPGEFYENLQRTIQPFRHRFYFIWATVMLKSATFRYSAPLWGPIQEEYAIPMAIDSTDSSAQTTSI